MGALKITVKTLQQKQFKLEVDSTDSILSVKEKIEQSQGHPVAQQKLIFSGKILSDDKTVEEYNITEKDFLVVMVSKPKATPASSSSAAKKESTPAATTPSKPAEPVKSESPAAAPASSNSPAPASDTPKEAEKATTDITGSQLESVLENMMAMGFERAQCERALRASFNNPDRAVEYLFNGIPENILNEMNAAQQPQSDEQQQDTNTPISPGTTTAPANDANAPLNLFAAAQQHAQQQQQQQQQQQPLGADLASFRNTPHFQQIRQLVQTNPGLLQPLLQSIGQSNPELIRAINADPNGFLQAFLEGAEGEEGGPETATIQVTAEEREAIERLEALGFPRQVVIEAYFACDKNEELAANYLFDHGNDDFE
ncbi:hypothetical protein CU097_011021 [Rhizopus azygosporus]|uniref:UV excision repair protein RAD23 n=1 Tax=Rhizopus azygosporus TaxID=86630 RepID=A0A367JQ30_RHIAZ|nr:hypothetical protein CU097_011021 [Rhizopus azygosporus]